MRDIGSIFPLYDADLRQRPGVEHDSRRVLYSLCREALGAVADDLKDTNKVVLIPAYTCSTVYLPFSHRGWKRVFYPITRDLKADTEALMELYEAHKPALTIFHPYFGKGLTQEERVCIKEIHSSGGKILIDNTQGILSAERLDEADYYTGSYRKWFPIPDGAYLESKRPIAAPGGENVAFCAAQRAAMYLRGIYFGNENEDVKQLSIKLNNLANDIADNYNATHKMSAFSESILAEQDADAIASARFANFEYLLDNLSNTPGISLPITSIQELKTAPLYFPVYADDRSSLQHRLAEHHIYLPVLWPVESYDVLIDEDAKYIYTQTLCIPIDQRYNRADMERVVSLIKH